MFLMAYKQHQVSGNKDDLWKIYSIFHLNQLPFVWVDYPCIHEWNINKPWEPKAWFSGPANMVRGVLYPNVKSAVYSSLCWV